MNFEIEIYRALPWKSISLWSILNSGIEKSEACTALRPSFPYIPTPTWASLIIETSLAPSPTAKVNTFLSSFLIILITSAFWPGLNLQQITASHVLLTLTKFISKSSLFVMKESAVFSTIIARFFFVDIKFSFCSTKSLEQYLATSLTSLSLNTSKSDLIS